MSESDSARTLALVDEEANGEEDARPPAWGDDEEEDEEEEEEEERGAREGGASDFISCKSFRAFPNFICS